MVLTQKNIILIISIILIIFIIYNLSRKKEHASSISTSNEKIQNIFNTAKNIIENNLSIKSSLVISPPYKSDGGNPIKFMLHSQNCILVIENIPGSKSTNFIFYELTKEGYTIRVINIEKDVELNYNNFGTFSGMSIITNKFTSTVGNTTTGTSDIIFNMYDTTKAGDPNNMRLVDNVFYLNNKYMYVKEMFNTINTNIKTANNKYVNQPLRSTGFGTSFTNSIITKINAQNDFNRINFSETSIGKTFDFINSQNNIESVKLINKPIDKIFMMINQIEKMSFIIIKKQENIPVQNVIVQNMPVQNMPVQNIQSTSAILQENIFNNQKILHSEKIQNIINTAQNVIENNLSIKSSIVISPPYKSDRGNPIKIMLRSLNCILVIENIPGSKSTNFIFYELTKEGYTIRVINVEKDVELNYNNFGTLSIMSIVTNKYTSTVGNTTTVTSDMIFNMNDNINAVDPNTMRLVDNVFYLNNKYMYVKDMFNTILTNIKTANNKYVNQPLQPTTIGNILNKNTFGSNISNNVISIINAQNDYNRINFNETTISKTFDFINSQNNIEPIKLINKPIDKIFMMINEIENKSFSIIKQQKNIQSYIGDQPTIGKGNINYNNDIIKMPNISDNFSKTDDLVLIGNVSGNVFGNLKNNNATLTIIDNKLVLFDHIKQQILWESSTTSPVNNPTSLDLGTPIKDTIKDTITNSEKCDPFSNVSCPSNKCCNGGFSHCN